MGVTKYDTALLEIIIAQFKPKSVLDFLINTITNA